MKEKDRAKTDEDGPERNEEKIRQALNDRLQEMRRLFDAAQDPSTGSGQVREDRQASENRYRQLLKMTDAIAATLEERDHYKKGHHCRVADLARAIATEMKLDRSRIDGLRIAGMIHDIGTIFLSLELLNKPTRFTEAENHQVRIHVASGSEILKDIPFPWPVARMVLEHHERLDGSGYPNGLMGKDLLMESRILTIADVVDAIASPRSYRPARGIDVALYDIKGYRGIRYEPAAVDACLRLFLDLGYKLLEE